MEYKIDRTLIRTGYKIGRYNISKKAIRNWNTLKWEYTISPNIIKIEIDSFSVNVFNWDLNCRYNPTNSILVQDWQI